MITNKKELFERIRRYQFERESVEDYQKKVNNLEKEIEESVLDIFNAGSSLDIAFSGGVDSSLILAKLCNLFPNQEINAWTIGGRADYPDIEYSRMFCEKLMNEDKNVSYNLMFDQVCPEDIEKSNLILGVRANKADNYYMLMKLISGNTDNLICCDIIDELAGGYYAHQKYPSLGTFERFLSNLIPGHLEILDKMSDAFRIKIFLPYGAEGVMDSTSRFMITELANGGRRKKPIYDIAKRNGVSEEILGRRKYGLVSAFD